MKRQPMTIKTKSFKAKRMTAQRKTAINRIRKQVIRQANQKLKEDIEKYSVQSQDNTSQYSSVSNLSNASASGHGKKRVVFDESSNQEYEYHLWEKLTERQKIEEESGQSQNSSNGKQIEKKEKQVSKRERVRTRSLAVNKKTKF